MILRTLGGLWLHGTRLSRPKPLLLLTYLALEGPQERRHLAELFWLGAARPLSNLSMALTRLRQGAPGSVGADDLRVWTDVDSDAGRLLATLEEGALEQTQRLYRGPFLGGLYLDWGPELEEWVYRTREFLGARVRDAMLGLATRAATQGQFEAAAKHAEHAYTVPGALLPEPEELGHLHTIMLAGNSIRTPEVGQEMVNLGLQPLPSAEAAKAHLQASISRSERLIPHHIPTRNTVFIGRGQERSEIADLLAQPDCRLMTLVGPAGSGKTRLALQVAREQLELERFPEGVHVVSLENLPEPSLIPSALASTLGLTFQGHDEPLAQVVRRIGAGAVLLVLDNFEHLMAGATLTATLLQGCPKLKLLVTSRERLNLEGEQVFPVEGLPFPKTEHLPREVAERADAVRLFMSRAKRNRPEFELNEDNLSAVLKICHLVEGLPLGLELAASWTKVISASEIANELAKNLDLLTTSTRDVPDRHRSLRAAFDHSWRLLTPKEQDALRRLAVFRGGFRREAAAAVAGTKIPGLASLIDKSLLRVLPSGRYDRHPLLYQYTREKLAERPGEEARARNLHGRYYLRFLTERVEGEMLGPRHPHVLAAIEEELENARTAWRWLVATAALENMVSPMKVTFALQEFYDRRGRFHEGLVFFDEVVAGLNSADTIHHALLGNVLVNRAYLTQRLARYQEARGTAQRGLELLRPLKEPWGIATGLYTLGLVARHTGELREAEGYFREGLVVTRALQDNFGHAGTNSLLYALAAVQQALGNYAQAQEHAEEVLDLARSQGNHINVVRSLNTLGNLRHLTGKLDEARILLHEALQLAQQMKFDDLIPQTLVYLGALSRDFGDDLNAHTFNRDALLMAQKSGDKALTNLARANLGGLASARGDYVQAQSYLAQALSTSWAVRDIPLVLTALLHLADLWGEQGRFEQAVCLANFVLHQYATEQPEKDRARLLLDALRGRMPSETMKAAVACSKSMNLDKTVTEILA